MRQYSNNFGNSTQHFRVTSKWTWYKEKESITNCCQKISIHVLHFQLIKHNSKWGH